MKLRAVLFDLDDTLTDRSASLEVYVVEFLEAFRARLKPMDDRLLLSQLSSVDRSGYNPQRSREAVQLPIWRSAPAVRELDAHWLAHFPNCAAPRHGALHTLRALRAAGFLLGVVTNGSSVSQRTKLNVLGMAELVDVIIISGEVQVKKPALGIFTHALKGLGVTAGACLFVGDNPRNDVSGALDIGMRAAWLRTHRHAWPSDLPSPPYEIEALVEVLQLVGIDSSPHPEGV
jgi:putative hydrolase of the HAD superfamily